MHLLHGEAQPVPDEFKCLNGEMAVIVHNLFEGFPLRLLLTHSTRTLVLGYSDKYSGIIRNFRRKMEGFRRRGIGGAPEPRSQPQKTSRGIRAMPRPRINRFFCCSQHYPPRIASFAALA